MKVLLIYPPQSHNVNPSPEACTFESSGCYPPIGLLHLAAPVVASGRYEVKVLDATTENMDYFSIKNYVSKENPDVVGISSNSFYFYDALLTAQAAKDVNKEIVVVSGGPHVWLYPKEVVKLKEFDYAISGEADSVFLDFLDKLERKNSVENIPGVITKNNLDRPVSPLIVSNLDLLPIPDRRLLNYRKYKSIVSKSNPITILMTSRGCPYRCNFCASGGQRVRFRSIQKVIEEIKDCLSLGIRDILFFDETFNFNIERVEEICDRILAEGLQFRWHARVRADRLHRLLLKKMKKAGCRLIQIGIESGTERVQKIIGKNLNLKEVERIVKIAKHEGILTYGNFMLANPTETLDEINATIEFSKRIKLDYAVYSITHLPPGTEFYQQALVSGKIKSDFWLEYATNPTPRLENIYWPGEFTKKQLYAVGRRAHISFYFRPGYVVSYIFKLQSLKQLLTHIKAFLNLIFGFLTRK